MSLCKENCVMCRYWCNVMTEFESGFTESESESVVLIYDSLSSNECWITIQFLIKWKARRCTPTHKNMQNELGISGERFGLEQSWSRVKSEQHKGRITSYSERKQRQPLLLERPPAAYLHVCMWRPQFKTQTHPHEMIFTSISCHLSHSCSSRSGTWKI